MKEIVEATPRPNLFRTLLILGRVSNLPTVWSNCLAAWLLNQGAAWSNFYVLIAGASSLYIGGMYLNDAFDAEFDRKHRIERPIPAGRISRRAVGQIGVALLGLGWLGLALLGLLPALVGLLLVGAIILYDAIHKRTEFAPLLMAGCRFLLCVLAAAATLRPVSAPVVAHAIALAAYVTGLSYLARVESTGSLAGRWPLALVFAPAAITLCVTITRGASSWLAFGIYLAWTCWCLRGVWRPGSRQIGRIVAGLLAGIVLVDWMALPRPDEQSAVGFVGLFLLALAMQRKIPAT